MSDDGLTTARALCVEANILVETFRPGKLAALDIGFAAMREERPFESAVAASSGVFTDMGLNRVLMGLILPSLASAVQPFRTAKRFDMLCEASRIEHRLPKPNHPWSLED